MDDYYWDTKIEYLRHSRDLFYNDDYLEFLVKSVWKIATPVHMIDFGCGYGYLGLKLLPLLPKGSRYTGVDLGAKLLDEARKLFKPLPYNTEFIQANIHEIDLERKYDIALCHAFLLHVPNPLDILNKMIDCVVDEGRIIAFEPHWIANMANFHLHGHDQSQIVQLGFLQKLYEQDAKRSGKDGNIGMKLPIYFNQLGLKDIQCRVTDKVNFLHPDLDIENKNKLYNSLRQSPPGDEREVFIRNLMDRGASYQEALDEYETESLIANQLTVDSFFTYASNMKITFGKVARV